jgi:BA14K-like protein
MVTSAKAAGTVSMIGAAMLLFSAPAEAGRGSAVGAGLLGFGVGAVVGSALTPREVYVAPPPPPPPVYYAPASYGPPPWSPDWYGYCGSRYPSFNPHTGYFIAPDGRAYFCR